MSSSPSPSDSCGQDSSAPSPPHLPQEPQAPPPPREIRTTKNNNNNNNDDDETRQRNPSPPHVSSSSSPLASSQQSSENQSKDTDFFASLRRIADEGISSALHSIFGLPSSLQTPSSSNWTMHDDDRDQPRSRRNNNNNDDDGSDDDAGNNPSRPASGWPPSSSYPPSSSAGGASSSASSRVGDNSWMDHPISSILLSLGIQSTRLLEQGFKSVNEELSKMQERQEILKQHHQRVFEQQRLKEKETAKEDTAAMTEDKEEVVRVGNRHRCHRHRHANHDPSGFWAEFFGEDMFGHRRTHPLFTSFFDEFLPDDPFGNGTRHGPFGGQTRPAHWGWGRYDDFFLSLIDERLRGPMKESMRQAEQMRDMHLLRQGFPASAHLGSRQELGDPIKPPGLSPRDRWALCYERAASNAVLAAIEQRQNQERQRQDRAKTDPTQNNCFGILWKSSKDNSPQQQPSPQEKRKLDTELDLYDFYSSKERGDESRANGDKRVVGTYQTSVTSQDSTGVVTSRTVKELHFSDGSVERTESTNEGESRQVSYPKAQEREQNAHALLPSSLLGKEAQKAEEPSRAGHLIFPSVNRDSKPTGFSTEKSGSPQSNNDSSGWRSLFWASENNK